MSAALGKHTSTGTPTASASVNHTSSLGAILGGILGGIALLLGLLLFLIYRSRQSSRREKHARYQLDTTAAPFTDTERTTPFKEKGVETQQIDVPSQPGPSSIAPSTSIIPSGAVSISEDEPVQVLSRAPAASSSTIPNPVGADAASVHGIYNLLTTLLMRIPSLPLHEEQPPHYDEARRD